LLAEAGMVTIPKSASLCHWILAVVSLVFTLNVALFPTVPEVATGWLLSRYKP
jgi:hypothetical protein